MIERWWWSLDDGRMVEVKAGLAVAGAIVMLWYWLADDVPSLRRGKLVRDVALALLGILSCASWWNFGRYHFNVRIHYHEMYHYYLGAKYAPELGFTRLYECTIAAEDERFRTLARANLDPVRNMQLDAALEHIAVRDLTTNVLGNSGEALAHPERCKEHFSPERWQAFILDSDFFRRASSWRYWSDALNDNGYNATPVWRLGAGLIANRIGVMNDDALNKISYLDPILLFAMMFAIWWAFGWRTLCVALIYFGNNYPARYWWTGGAFLRMDWVAAMVAGICCLKKERPALSGFFIAYSALLRIFPGFVAIPLILKIAIQTWRDKKLSWTTNQKRFVLSAAVTVVVLVPVSAIYSKGFDSWTGFVANSKKHLSTPLTNNMGWRTVVAYDRGTRAQVQRDYRMADPFGTWKFHQNDNYERRKPIFVIGLLGFLALAGMAVRKHDDWIALVIGTGVIIFAAQLTCYYYIAFLALGLLWPYIPWSGWALSLLTAVSCWIPMRFLGWDDERYVAITIAYIVMVLALTAALTRMEPPAAPAAAASETPKNKRRRAKARRA